MAGDDHVFFWNLTDRSGRRVPAGVYHVQLRAGDHTAVGKTTVIR